VTEKDSIKELFRDSFEGYQESVRPELWERISSSIAPATPPVTDPVSQPVSAISQFAGQAMTWIIGGVVTVATVSGIYLYNRNQSAPVTPPAVVESEITHANLQETSDPAAAIPASEVTAIEKNEQAEKPEVSSGTEYRTAGKLQTSSLPEKPAATSVSATSNSASLESQVITRETISGKVSETQTPNQSGSPESAISAVTSEVKPVQLMATKLSGSVPFEVQFSLTGNLGSGEITDWNFGDGPVENSARTLNHTFENPGQYQVTVRYKDHQGKSKFQSVTIQAQGELLIANVPNIFTPNQDGSNDTFTFDTSNLTDYEVFIYDRSGKQVHRWAAPVTGWDGRLNSGKDAPEGTYFYVIFATGHQNQKSRQQGTITIYR
jgi:gliding motility-associated-like protein